MILLRAGERREEDLSQVVVYLNFGCVLFSFPSRSFSLFCLFSCYLFVFTSFVVVVVVVSCLCVPVRESNEQGIYPPHPHTGPPSFPPHFLRAVCGRISNPVFHDARNCQLPVTVFVHSHPPSLSCSLFFSFLRHRAD